MDYGPDRLCQWRIGRDGELREEDVQADPPGGIAHRFQAAWNAHDMAAFADLFHADATFVNRLGSYWRGRDRIVAEHRAIHETIYRDMTIRNVVLDVDRIGEDVATVHLRSEATMGEAMPHGPRRLDTLMLAVMTRREGVWRIQAGENVAVVDPRTGAPILAE